MNRTIYQFAIGMLAWLEAALAPFNKKFKMGSQGRKMTILSLNRAGHITGRKPVVWFHAASLGEFEQGRPVIEEFKKRHPKYFILLTFFSPSGFEVQKDYRGADYICYLPMDEEKYAAKFVDCFKPQIAFFIKYEFWPNYLESLWSRQVPTIFFSCIFRPGSAFFKSYGEMQRTMLKRVNYLFVQDEQSRELLEKINIRHVTVAGDTRFDRVYKIADRTRALPVIEQFADGQQCLIAGSVWEADMKVLIPALRNIKGIKAVIVPHEIHREQLRGWKKALGSKTMLHSELTETTDLAALDYLIIDNVGMLSSIYQYGAIAYIGGAFGAGLHNILEAATFGLPVLFGNKNYHKFKEANDLLERGGAVSIGDSGVLQETMQRWLTDETLRSDLGQRNRNYVQENIGATDYIMTVVDNIVESISKVN